MIVTVFFSLTGTPEERGLILRKTFQDPEDENIFDDEISQRSKKAYDIKCLQPLLAKCKCFEYIPFLPSYQADICCRCSCKEREAHDLNNVGNNMQDAPV